MPAAAVIPAPIAYIKVVAVKKLVVGSQTRGRWSARYGCVLLCPVYIWFMFFSALHWVLLNARNFTLKKLECSKQAVALEYCCME